MQKTIGVSEEIYSEIVALKGSLMMQRKKPVSLPETIKFLLQTRENFIERLSSHPRNPKKARQLKKCRNLTAAEQYLIDAEDWVEETEKKMMEAEKNE